jgi:hypothetical protein
MLICQTLRSLIYLEVSSISGLDEGYEPLLVGIAHVVELVDIRARLRSAGFASLFLLVA